MVKNTKTKNAFYFFMLDWKDQQRTPGKSLKEVSADPRCSEEWKSLPLIRREYYKALTKVSKIQDEERFDKKNSIGQSLREVRLQECREEEFRQNMLQYISSVVSLGLKHNNLRNLKFLFIHVNWFYIKEIGINKFEYGPAEFAVAEFSLKNGIENVYHEILRIPIPLGWKGDAIKISEETHQIPINFSEGESNFHLMYTKLVKLLESNKTGNKFPPLFTIKSTTDAVNSLLLMMTEAANRSVDDFQVYSLEALFAELRSSVVEARDGQSIPLVVAEIEFGKDVFAFIRGAECNFHKLLDNTSQYCSKSVVTRWGYTICDYCCQYMDIDMIEGVHCPISLLDHQQSKANDIDVVSTSMERLSTEHGNQVNVLETNGVSRDHKMRVSERTDAEEIRRRVRCKPLKIIDHSKVAESNISNSTHLERPLRLPKTKPISVMLEENAHPLNEVRFPSMGRGIRIKESIIKIQSPGESHACQTSSF